MNQLRRSKESSLSFRRKTSLLLALSGSLSLAACLSQLVSGHREHTHNDNTGPFQWPIDIIKQSIKMELHRAGRETNNSKRASQEAPFGPLELWPKEPRDLEVKKTKSQLKRWKSFTSFAEKTCKTEPKAALELANCSFAVFEHTTDLSSSSWAAFCICSLQSSAQRPTSAQTFSGQPLASALHCRPSSHGSSWLRGCLCATYRSKSVVNSQSCPNFGQFSSAAKWPKDT